MKTYKEVQSFLANELHEQLLPLEEYRKARVHSIRKNLITGSILFILPVVVAIYLSPPLAFFSSLIPLTFFGLAYQTYLTMLPNLQREFKYNILHKLLSFLFTQYEYIPNQKIARSVFITSKLISDEITEVEGEDFMRFRLGETGIMFSECGVYKLGKTSPTFIGIFLVSTFNKSFCSDILVLPNHLIAPFRMLTKQIFGDFRRIHLEDAAFNDAFMVFSTDQIESRYILTPGLMSRMLDYRNKTRKRIAFSFIDDRMYCAIPNYTDLFEPAIFNSFMDEGFMEKNYGTIKLYTDIVDDLNLNLRIWKKT